MTPLEQRYRRLLRWYPAEHRATYGAEMLGVLLDSAAPGQSRPSTRERLDLLRGAGTCRLTAIGRAYDGRSWRAAMSAVAVVLLAITVVDPLPYALSSVVHRLGNPLRDTYFIPPFAVYAFALVTALVGPRWLRRLAAAAIIVLLVDGIVRLVQLTGLPPNLGALVFTGFPAICLALGSGGRSARRVLGRRRGVILVALAIAMAAPLSEAEWFWDLHGAWQISYGYLLACAVVAAAGRPSPVRIRLAALFAVVLSLYAIRLASILFASDSIGQPWRITTESVLYPGLLLILVFAVPRLVRYRERSLVH